MKAIFWDLDGVLIDSMDVHAKAGRVALKEFGLDISLLEMKKLGGMPFREIVLKTMHKNNVSLSGDKINEVCKRKKDITEDNDYLIKPFRIKDDLKALKEKYGMYIVTGSIKSFVKDKVERYFNNIFKDVICTDDIKRGKPYPDPYLEALKRVGLRKKDCVIIEDSPLGILSGKSANIKTIGICTSLPKKYLLDSDIVFNDHRDLFEYLKFE